jgi:pyoverdine/dityrosine biosynthesis protein Dit1
MELTNSIIQRAVAPAKTAADLLTDVMRFRRIAGPDASCGTLPCQSCLAPHMQKVMTAIALKEPITFVLPAFPGKSPNPNKVLGPLPDMAEQLALEFLGHLCERVRKYHSPGARVILCSDGRVFSDAVGMREEDVTAYQRELSRMIERLDLSSISTYNLDDSYEGQNFIQMRRDLMAQYGKSLDVLRAMVRDGGNRIGGRENEDAHRLYCGITRFLVEDAMRPGQTQSRTAIQKECRIRAYEVIQRSNAWSELIANRFPDAVRLSIHPQICGAKKLGIRLVGNENWMTPWHGVAVDVGGRFLLLKRSQAEALGARVVYSAGRASHYELAVAQQLAKVSGV